MRKHGGTASQRDKYVTLAAISPPGVARGRFVGGHQSGLAGCKSPFLFKRQASSCSSQRQRQREPLGASPGPSAPTYLPTSAYQTTGVEEVNFLVVSQEFLLLRISLALCGHREGWYLRLPDHQGGRGELLGGFTKFSKL